MIIENGVLVNVSNDDIVDGTVIIPDETTSIGDMAFYNCISLTNIMIPANIMSIGKWAFFNCHHLVEIKNLSALEITVGSEDNGNIGRYAKRVYTEGESCLSIDENGYVIYSEGSEKILVAYTGAETDLNLPSGITQICKFAFYCCDSLKTVIIPNTVKAIGRSAFDYCLSLTSVIIPDSVKSIDRRAFSDCNSLTSIVIPDSVISIGDSVFENCISLTNVMIGNGVTSIGECVFSDCYCLTSITIGNGVTNIGTRMFECCSNLTSVTIGNGVMSIGDHAFYNCNSLVSKKSNYKAFKLKNGELCCGDKKYIEDAENSVPGELKICENGIHYCTNLFEIFNYYHGEIDKDIAIYEIEVGDKILTSKSSKCCTNSCVLKRRLYRDDIIKILNGEETLQIKKERLQNKKRQIEEIRELMRLLDKCVPLNLTCIAEVATIIYGNNYRKLPKDSVVILEEELKKYEQFKSFQEGGNATGRDDFGVTGKGVVYSDKHNSQEKHIEEMEKFIIKTRNILRNILLTDSRPIKNTSKKDCYLCLMELQELYKSNNSISDKDF